MARARNNSIQKLISSKGMMLWIPVHMSDVSYSLSPSDIDIHACDDSQLFPLGTKLEFADGRLFRYCRASSGGIGYTARLVANGYFDPGGSTYADTNGFAGYVYSAITAGDTEVNIADTTVRDQDYYAGGIFSYSPAGGQYITHRIVGSDKGNGSYVKLYLEDACRSALATSSRETRSYPSKWGNVIGGLTTQQWKSFICVNQVAVTASYWFWGQTRGECHLVNYGDGANIIGGTINYREVWGMVTDGSVCSYSSTPTGYQRIGYCLPCTESAYGTCLVQLQLE